LNPSKFIPISELISLKGKKAIITGGAMGIGFAISYRLAEAGAAIAIADINETEAEKACQKLKKMGYLALAIKCDVSREEDIKSMISIAVKELGGIDILVNNAGIYPRIPIEKMTTADFDHIISTNLKSIFLSSREAIRNMIEQNKGGCIINLASIDAVHPSGKGLIAYDTSKGGVLTMTKSLALEIGQHSIRVNSIAPGAILTEGAITTMRETSSGSGKSLLKALMARMALGRMGNADDIGRVALFLASDLASYITGSVIYVDGGYLIS
jgi:2-deoxy-D-gluconate 3-dehydrogenase